MDSDNGNSCRHGPIIVIWCKRKISRFPSLVLLIFIIFCFLFEWLSTCIRSALPLRCRNNRLHIFPMSLQNKALLFIFIGQLNHVVYRNNGTEMWPVNLRLVKFLLFHRLQSWARGLIWDQRLTQKLRSQLHQQPAQVI